MKTLTDLELQYIQDLLVNDIQSFYDDPSDFTLYDDSLDETLESSYSRVKERINLLKSILPKFELDFDTVVEEECSLFDIKRINSYLETK